LTEGGIDAAARRPAAQGSAALPPVALYVHIPFCVSLCPYCDFVVYAGAATRGPRSRVAAFVQALRTEIELRADNLDRRVPEGRPSLETVYLGGGTPTLLSGAAIAALLELIDARLGIASGAEITIEANPGRDERGVLRDLVAAGVTRISLGAQSFQATELRRLGRRHAPADVTIVVEEARAAGIGSVSLDLLYDVPGQSLDSWSATLEAALALRPDHLSAYALTLDDPDAEGITGQLGDHLPTRAGARRWRAAAVREQDDDRAAEQYELATARLSAAGYRGYEISNWARPGHESRHNLVYWRRVPYEAVGPGAHAFDGHTRRWDAARLDGYLAALAPADGSAPMLPPGGSEGVDERTATVEATVLSLRLDTGLDLEAARVGPLGPHLAWAREAGLLESTGGIDGGPTRVRLTTRGRLLSNELFTRLS
jgi:putative oxygen-independent coproporphyrinogen III oxidase